MMAVFAALALSAASLSATTDQNTSLLELLTWAFIFGALFFLGVAILAGLGLLAVLFLNYIHAVEVLSGTWYLRYWPAQRITQVSGVSVKMRESAGQVQVESRSCFLDGTVVASSSSLVGSGTGSPSFPQEAAEFDTEPREGDLATVTITAKPGRWRGISAKRSLEVEVGITDHRKTVTSEQVHSALKQLDSLVDEAQAILDECGRPVEQMVGAPPMHFQQECIPRINKFYSDAIKAIVELVPEFRGRFENVGNVTHNTEVKPAMIQQVEKWLENLKWIEDELRRRLD